MFKQTFAAAAAVAMLAGFATPAFAGAQDFTVHNETGMELVELYVQASSAEDWGDELLGDEPIENGGASEISFEGEEECKFDIWVKDSKGGKWQVTGLDLCKIHDFTLTKKGNKLVWAAE